MDKDSNYVSNKCNEFIYLNVYVWMVINVIMVILFFYGLLRMKLFLE